MSETLWQRLIHGGRRVWQRADWAEFVEADWADRIMNLAVTDRFHAKQARSTGRWILRAGDRSLAVYLKRHYRLPRWRGLMATVWPERGWSPALEEYQHLQWARARGIPVPSTVAAGECLEPWGRLQSFLAVEELPGMIPLHEGIPLAAETLPPAAFASWKRGLCIELVRLTQELHQRRRFHKDLYLCHFYIPRELVGQVRDWQGRVHLIDFHRLGYHPLAWRFWQVKDLAQLLYSSEVDGITARDRMRFWRTYLGTARESLIDRLVRRCILFKFRRYRRHNAKSL